MISFLERIVLALLLSELTGGVLYHLIHNYSSPTTIFGTDPLFCSRGFAHFKATSSLGIREVWHRTSCLEGSLQTHKSPGKCAAYNVCIQPILILPRAFHQLWNVTSYLDCAAKMTMILNAFNTSLIESADTQPEYREGCLHMVRLG